MQFEETNHHYYCNGERCPSITQVISYRFKDKYKGVDPKVLENAARLGTQLHSAIELYETLGIANEELVEVSNYIKLKEQEKFEVLENEIPIVLRYKDMTICGRLDMKIKEDDEIGLGDIKRTYELDVKYLCYQLNLYRLAYMQCYDGNLTFLRGLHLRNKIKRYVAIPIKEDMAYELLEDYYQNVYLKENLYGTKKTNNN